MGGDDNLVIIVVVMVMVVLMMMGMVERLGERSPKSQVMEYDDIRAGWDCKCSYLTLAFLPRKRPRLLILVVSPRLQRCVHWTVPGSSTF